MKQFHNKYLKVPLLFSGGGGDEWQNHLQPCEWIMADNNSYIATNYLLKDVTDINIEYIFDSSVTLQNASLFGSTSRPYLMVKNNINNYAIYCDSGIDQNKSDVFQKIIYDNTGVYLNGVKILDNTLPLNNPDKLFLFCRLYNNTINAYGENIKIKRFATNFFNFIAVYVIDEYVDNKGNLCNEGVSGMVDTLSGVFYTNDGRGQFIHGGDIEI